MPSLRAKDFTPGQPVELTLKQISSKNVPSQMTPGGMQGAFMTSEGTLYLDPEPASDLERQLLELGVIPGERVRIVKIKTTHGGHRWIVQRPPSLEQQLADSITNVERNPHGHGRYMPAEQSPAPPAPIQRPAVPAPHAGRENGLPHHAPEAPAPNPATARLMSCFAMSVDAIQEAQQYAHRKGLGVTFSSEDVRATAISCWIQMQREGGVR